MRDRVSLVALAVQELRNLTAYASQVPPKCATTGQQMSSFLKRQLLLFKYQFLYRQGFIDSRKPSSCKGSSAYQKTGPGVSASSSLPGYRPTLPCFTRGQATHHNDPSSSYSLRRPCTFSGWVQVAGKEETLRPPRDTCEQMCSEPCLLPSDNLLRSQPLTTSQTEPKTLRGYCWLLCKALEVEPLCLCYCWLLCKALACTVQKQADENVLTLHAVPAAP